MSRLLNAAEAEDDRAPLTHAPQTSGICEIRTSAPRRGACHRGARAPGRCWRWAVVGWFDLTDNESDRRHHRRDRGGRARDHAPRHLRRPLDQICRVHRRPPWLVLGRSAAWRSAGRPKRLMTNAGQRRTAAGAAARGWRRWTRRPPPGPARRRRSSVLRVAPACARSAASSRRSLPWPVLLRRLLGRAPLRSRPAARGSPRSRFVLPLQRSGVDHGLFPPVRAAFSATSALTLSAWPAHGRRRLLDLLLAAEGEDALDRAVNGGDDERRGPDAAIRGASAGMTRPSCAECEEAEGSRAAEHAGADARACPSAHLGARERDLLADQRRSLPIKVLHEVEDRPVGRSFEAGRLPGATSRPWGGPSSGSAPSRVVHHGYSGVRSTARAHLKGRRATTQHARDEPMRRNASRDLKRVCR